MRIAITGGTGFVGRHLAERYNTEDVVIISRRTGIGLDAIDALAKAFEGCDVVAHCAGINREIGTQTYMNIHVLGTANVLAAAKKAGVKKILLMSFLRARPYCGSAYHESKWAAEELVRASGLDYTILKAGMTYGLGDHMLDHLSHVTQTIPFLPTVGFKTQRVRPLAIDDLVDVLVAAAAGELPYSTVSVLGAEEMTFAEAVHRVANEVHRKVLIFPLPVWFQMSLAQVWEWTMKVPLAAKAQVFILSEGLTEATPPVAELPEHLRPHRMFTPEIIRAGLPEPGPFTVHDLRFFN